MNTNLAETNSNTYTNAAQSKHKTNTNTTACTAKTDINTDTVTGAQRARLLASLITDLTGHGESIKRIMDTFSWATATSADPKAA